MGRQQKIKRYRSTWSEYPRCHRLTVWIFDNCRFRVRARVYKYLDRLDALLKEQRQQQPKVLATRYNP